MNHPELPAVILAAFILDMLIGDPRYRWHPIRIIGNSISSLVGILKMTGLTGRAGGIILATTVATIFVAAYLLMQLALEQIHPLPAMLLDLFLCYSFLAVKDLSNHTRPVIACLEQGDLPGARKAVSMVVGRDVNSLDHTGVIRASVETLAENFVDGFLSPIFWYVIAGLTACLAGLDPLPAAVCLMLIFKVASTLDSMVGYKNDEFSGIGWAGARLDDLMNFIPARLCLVILSLGVAMTGLDPVTGFKVAMRDRLKHDSPNAAHAESFVAGALGVRLGGPTVYSEGLKNKPWLAEDYPDPGIEDIRRATNMLNASAWISVILSVAVLAVKN
ncbi:Cobalamin biosynthesis protein CobD [uncultured Desulfobacterium sp.]|uniref:Cobalamin biosynthesis protein CobD n=1 Tax=uncultured Desulfobacterium sp. TaxID=201089 RepID=A0A445N2F6_9BACT|nr:Cobalamin biosynthesis protein CobD [uncultured Desulfobacterium sp.]